MARSAPEIAAALPTWAGRGHFAVSHLGRALRYPMRPTQMAAWVEAWMGADLVSDCQSIRVPTLVTTGEPALDRVVPVASSLDYLRLIPGAEHVQLARTGHLGIVTRPEAYAALVARFALDARL
jgi:pimeloyl-ACP methyl ester carboxylesterase